MRRVILAFTLASAVSWAQSAPKLLLLPTEGDRVGREVTASVDETVAAELSKKGLVLVRFSEVALSTDKAADLARCAGSNVQCAKDLGIASGADRLLLPRISRYAKGFRLQLAVIDVKSGERLSNVGERARSDSALRDAAIRLAERISAEVQTGSPAATDPVEERESEGMRPWPYVGLGAGAVLLGAGTYWMLQARDAHDELVAPSTGGVISPEHRREVVSRGQLYQTLGWAAVGVGAAAIVGGVLTTVEFDTETDVSAWIVPGGGGVMARIALP